MCRLLTLLIECWGVHGVGSVRMFNVQQKESSHQRSKHAEPGVQKYSLDSEEPPVKAAAAIRSGEISDSSAAARWGTVERVNGS